MPHPLGSRRPHDPALLLNIRAAICLANSSALRFDGSNASSDLVMSGVESPHLPGRPAFRCRNRTSCEGIVAKHGFDLDERRPVAEVGGKKRDGSTRLRAQPSR